MFSLHAEALCWLRFGKRMPIVCTEAGSYNADVVGLNSSMAIEVEIKKSMSDLRAEFRNKPHKHHVYSHADQFTRSGGYVPNYFYFFVPDEMAEKARAFIDEKAPRAGLVVRQRPASTAFGAGKHNVYVAKRPGKLHDRSPSPQFLRAALMRMSSEICTFRLNAEKLKAETGQELLRNAMTSVVGIEGTLDFEDTVADVERRGAELAWAVEERHWRDLSHVERAKWLFAAQRLLNIHRSQAKDLNHEAIA